MRAYYTDFMRFFKAFRFGRRVYLDYASATPLDTKTLSTFPKLSKSALYANPSALHQEGVIARTAKEAAHTLVAQVLRAHPDEIVFTSGATESDNLALIGTIRNWLLMGTKEEEIAFVTSALEHAAVAEVATVFQNIFHIVLPAPEGVVEFKGLQFEPMIKKVLISVMYVNNEIGTIQPIKEIAKLIRRFRKQYPDIDFVFHVDATQAPLYENIRIDQLGVDLLTLGATKLYTHRGVGVLYKKRNIKLSPIMHGGGQERGLRPGTESTQLIHAFAHALAYAQQIREQEMVRVQELQRYFEMKLQREIPEAIITAVHQPRSPHISHVAIPNFDSELLVLELDARGVAVSAKSACKNEEDTESPIVEAIYGAGYGAVRFSFGRNTTKRELDRAIKALVSVVRKYRRL